MNPADNNELLQSAIWEGHFSQVLALVKDGTDINAISNTGHTPLMLAVESDNTKIAKFLLESGAAVNKPGFEGATPLHLAVDISIDGNIQAGIPPGQEPLEMIYLLLKYGADKNLKNDKGQSPLDWAEDYKNNRVIKVLSR